MIRVVQDDAAESRNGTTTDFSPEERGLPHPASHGIRVRVRLLPLLAFVVLTATPLLAQEQERKLAERLQRPNMNMTFNPGSANFSTNHSFKTKDATSKSFGFDQKVNPAEFRSKSFGGTKNAWGGDFRFSANQANTKGKYEVPNASREVETKTKAVKDARESNKEMATREFAGQRPFLNRGKSQDKFDREGPTPGDSKPVGWTGEMKPMTIDDVRELLNKNK